MVGVVLLDVLEVIARLGEREVDLGEVVDALRRLELDLHEVRRRVDRLRHGRPTAGT